MRTREDVIARIAYFLQQRDDVKAQFLQQLETFRAALATSEFFRTHEVVGSSLLFVYDTSGRVCLKMIDFGKTIPREHPLHSDKWDVASLNHADGYLLGLDNLVSVLRDA